MPRHSFGSWYCYIQQGLFVASKSNYQQTDPITTSLILPSVVWKGMKKGEGNKRELKVSLGKEGYKGYGRRGGGTLAIMRRQID